MHGGADDAAIVISRKRAWRRDGFRSYVILVDGKPVSKIRNGQRVEVPVSHGQHELRLKIDWCASQSLTFGAQPGDVIEFLCEPGGSTFAGLQDVLTDPGRYITLTRADRHAS
jgi:hypothetical protein